MAKDKITEYDATANNNTVCGDVNIAENSALPSDMNNFAREIMSHLKEGLGSGTPLYVDQTNNRLGINSSSPATALDVDGTATVNRLSTDGTIIDLQKDGSAVGSIGVTGTDILYVANPDGSAVGFNFDGDNPKINPCDGTGSGTDGVADLGHSGGRYKDLYLSGGAYLGGTGSANYLDDYEEGTWTAGFQGATVSATNTTGYYTKIGRQVFFNYYTDAMTISSVSGAALINGLPFTSSNASQNYGLFTYVHGTAVTGSKGGFVSKNATHMTFINDDNTTSASYVSGSNKYAMVSGFYFVD